MAIIIMSVDLKQDNVMVVSLILNGNVNAKVTDFGTSCISDINKEFLTTNIGTTRYLPPEAVDNINSREKFDVYSFSLRTFSSSYYYYYHHRHYHYIIITTNTT